MKPAREKLTLPESIHPPRHSRRTSASAPTTKTGFPELWYSFLSAPPFGLGTLMSSIKFET